MKIPKHKYVSCIGRCPKQFECFNTSRSKEPPLCTLAYYSYMQLPMHNLIKVLEVDNADT